MILKLVYAGKLLARLRSEGRCEMVFECTPEFQETFEEPSAHIRFETHRDLDAKVEQWVLKDSNFITKYPEEWALLKSFDRAFWLRYH